MNSTRMCELYEQPLTITMANGKYTYLCAYVRFANEIVKT